jgi:hypothetical protein
MQQHAIIIDMTSVARVVLLAAIVGFAALVVRSVLVAPVPTPVAVATPAATLRVATGTAAPNVAPTARAGAGMFSLSLSDADLTRAAASAFPQTVSGVTVSDPVVRIQPGGVRLVASAKVLFGTTQFVLNATPVISDGKLAVRVDSATVAGFGVSDSTKASIAETMRATVAPLIPADVRLQSVTLGTGNVTVQGTQ